MQPIDQRNFLLNLSPFFGQLSAMSEGFTPPPVDIRELEQADVAVNWAKLSRNGAMEHIGYYAYWIVNLMKQDWWSDGYITAMMHSFQSAMASAVISLEEAGTISFTKEVHPKVALFDDDTQQYVPMSSKNDYTYKEQIGHLDWEPDVASLMQEDTHE